jgi:hypothetical protein
MREKVDCVLRVCEDMLHFFFFLMKDYESLFHAMILNIYGSRKVSI